MVSDPDITQPAPLVAAGLLMANRKAFGLLWLDEDLIVRARFGPLVDFVAVDESVLDALYALIGLEGEIASLRDDPDRVIYLPGIATINQATDTPRLDLTIFWSEAEKRYLVLIARALSKSGLEEDLSKQMRARLIAETEVAEKSRELSKANKDLARANQDLEEYAAIISHDLKAPLRGLRYCADEIAEAITNGDKKNAQTHLQKLQAQSMRMSQMMTALLDYASVGRKSEVVETVNTHDLVREITSSLSHRQSIEIHIAGNWPTLETLKAPLDLVIRNLVDNAIKHHDSDTAQIAVSAATNSDTLTITIDDDGPGIAPNHHAAIFMPFRTLQNNSGNAGGMGLALVKRTVDSVGGSLTVVSDPAQSRGSKMVVHWPLRLADQKA